VCAARELVGAEGGGGLLPRKGSTNSNALLDEGERRRSPPFIQLSSMLVWKVGGGAAPHLPAVRGQDLRVRSPYLDGMPLLAVRRAWCCSGHHDH